MNLYLDLDGVLVDLIGDYVKLTGMTLSEADAKFGHNSPEIWEPAKAVPKFWANLSKTQEADSLLTFVRDNFSHDKTFVLTARPRVFEDATVDKREWVKKNTHISEENVYVVLRSEKKLFAVNENGAPNILVDDHPVNVKDWRKAGGIAIHHTDINITIQNLNGVLAYG